MKTLSLYLICKHMQSQQMLTRGDYDVLGGGAEKRSVAKETDSE